MKDTPGHEAQRGEAGNRLCVSVCMCVSGGGGGEVT